MKGCSNETRIGCELKRLVHFSWVFSVLLTALLGLSVLGQDPFLGAEDDAFFYFRIAGNVVQNGFFSFDGLTPTNGFHPLWMGLLTGLRYFCPDPSGYLSMAAVLSILLLGLCGVRFALFARGRYSAPVQLFILLLLLRYFRDFSLMCMETSVLLPAAFLLLISFDGLKGDSGSGRLWTLGVLVALTTASRLDSALLCAILAVSAVATCGRRALLPILLPGAVLFLGYAALNQSFMGTPASVSGMMKASGFGFNRLFAAQLFRLGDPLGARSPWGLYLLFLLLAFPVSFMKSMPSAARVSGVFLISFTLCQLFLSQWRLWYWYTYPAVIFLAFGLPPLLQRLYDMLALPERAGSVSASALFIILCGSCFFWGLSYGDVGTSDFRHRNMLIALELNETLPDTAVVAMGDRAGSFAYFFHGHVVQAEALSGDTDLAAAVRSGTLERYLHSVGTDFILSWTGPHLVDDYDLWTLAIPDRAQCTAFSNTITVRGTDEVARWPGNEESAFLWSFSEN